MKKISWGIFAFLCVLVSLYPWKYLFGDKNVGLLSTKTAEILNDNLWNIGFNGHIFLGGIALMIGWTQFSKKWRSKYMNWHKKLGKVYVLSVLISGLSGLFIAIYASGGPIAQTGFTFLGVFWVATTFLGYRHIKNGNVALHQDMMIYSYALCFAAVTLRLLIPIFMIFTNDFFFAYRIIAWLCWVPNLLVAYLIVDSNRKTRSLSL